MRRKLVQEYTPAISLSPSSDEDSDPDEFNALPNVRPKDDNSAFAPATAFTHPIHIVPADAVETGVHTLRLPIPPPAAQPSVDAVSISELLFIDESHRDIQFMPRWRT
ncbi:hypothetical protein C8R44DRAFT_880044 [Mycena epipterygia]|nr:hypothetical protein C8R44DRAFT_880044 [Mycena epipterygia]